MKQLPNKVKKERSREVSVLVDSWTDVYAYLVGTTQRCCVVDVAADGRHLVAHSKSYTQVRRRAVGRLTQQGPGACCGFALLSVLLPGCRLSLPPSACPMSSRPLACLAGAATAQRGRAGPDGVCGGSAHHSRHPLELQGGGSEGSVQPGNPCCPRHAPPVRHARGS